MSSNDESLKEYLGLFLQCAELGVTGEEFALSIGASIGVLDGACQVQWGKNANEVAASVKAGSPVRLIASLLGRAKQGDVQAIRTALEYRDSIRGIDNAPKMSDTDLVREAREILAKLEADPNMKMRLVKT